MTPRPKSPTRKRRRQTPNNVKRSELTSVLDQLRQHAHNLDIQFRRIADIQADVDDLKRRIKGRKSRG
jgi:hypothetical protein